MRLENENYSEVPVQKNDIFICSIGYEARSTYLYEKFLTKVDPNNILVFSFDYLLEAKFKESGERYKVVSEATVISSSYDNVEDVLKHIQVFIKARSSDARSISIHVDYSGMPRNWYCRFPSEFGRFLTNKDVVYFWYVDGIYKEDYRAYPCAGIENYHLFSGKPTLRSGQKRVHMICLSYDNTRTLAAISTLDPELLIVFDAFDSNRREIHDNVVNLNKSIISRAARAYSLQMDDFVLMLSNLCELSNGYVVSGDVILVPDGPKPLIFAMSLVTYFVDKPGITCLHMTRNREYFSPPEVFPTDRVIGFSIKYAIS